MRNTIRLASAFLLIFCAHQLSAQTTPKTAPVKPANFNDIQKKAELYFDQHPELTTDEEEDGMYKQYKRWEWYTENRVMPNGDLPAPGLMQEEWKKYARSHGRGMASTASVSGNWSFLGPNTTPGGYTGLGRIACIAFHPTIANTFWIGSPGGGLWKTTDGGNTWSTNSDNFPVMGISDIAIDPTNPNNMYVATGDGDFGSLSAVTGAYTGDTKSIGVLKSTDGGVTWNYTGLNFTVQVDKLIRRLIISPTNPNVLIAACSDGVYRTNDAGVTWTNTVAGHYMDLAFKPGDASVVYAAQLDASGNAQVLTSTDTANSFTVVTSFSNVVRIALGVTPFAPNVVHALCADATTKGFAGLYASRNSGASFDVLYAAGGTNLLNTAYDGSGTTGQGNYDLCYLMSPTDTNTLFVGGVNTWKSTDGGRSWALNTMWTGNAGQNPNQVITVHADKHSMANDPLNAGTIYQTNDGGIYSSTDGGTTWVDRSNGLGISQIYRISTSATNAFVNLAGLQDNGSRVESAGNWAYATGGDGCECIIDYTNANNMYASYVRGVIYATSNAWTSGTTTISSNIPGGQPTGSWVTPYIMDPVNPSTLYAGYSDIYKTTDQGNSWAAISSGLTGSSTNYLKMLAIAPSNVMNIYAGTWDSLWATPDGGNTWTSISNFSLGNRKTFMAVNPNNPLNVWVTIGRYAAGEKVYKTLDGGNTWTNVSGTLPNLPVNTIVYENGTKDGLYVGTDVGVFYTDSTMTDWIPYSTGLPNVVVTDLQIQNSSGELRAGTFGRGMWKTDLYNTHVGIKNEPSLVNNIQIFPNPGKGLFTLSISDFKQGDKANLYNCLGETLKVIDIRNASMQLDLSTYADGIYYIGLESEHYRMHRVVKLE